MKPSHEYCKKYCDLYDECVRTNCNRHLVLWAHKDSSMEEEKIWKPIDTQLRKRAWKESRVVKVNF